MRYVAFLGEGEEIFVPFFWALLKWEWACVLG